MQIKSRERFSTEEAVEQTVVTPIFALIDLNEKILNREPTIVVHKGEK